MTKLGLVISPRVARSPTRWRSRSPGAFRQGTQAATIPRSASSSFHMANITVPESRSPLNVFADMLILYEEITPAITPKDIMKQIKIFSLVRRFNLRMRWIGMKARIKSMAVRMPASISSARINYGSHDHTARNIAKVTDMVTGPATDVVYRFPGRPERTTAKEVENHKDDI